MFNSKRTPLLLSSTSRNIIAISLSMLLQLRLRELGASLFLISILSTVKGGISGFSSPFWGSISDTGNKKRLITIVIFLIPAFSYPIYGLSDIPVTFLIITGIIAFFDSGFTPVSLSLSINYSDGSKRSISRELSFLNAANAVGMFLGRIILSLILLFLTIKYSILFMSIFGILALIFSIFVSYPENIQKENISANKKLFAGFSNLKKLKKNGLWSIFAGSFIRFVGVTGTTSVIAVFMTEKIGLTDSFSMVVASLDPLFMFFSHLFFGKFIYKIGAKNSINVGIIMTVISILCFAFAQSWILIGIGWLLIGLAFGGFWIGVTTYISINIEKENRGKYMGLLSTTSTFGSMLGPFLTGLILSINNSYVIMFIIMAIINLTGLFIINIFAKSDMVN
jgi:MFS family permease